MKQLKYLILAAFMCATAYATDSTTSNLGLTLPTIGSPTWGSKLNSNFSIIDSSVPCLACNNTYTGTNSFGSLSIRSATGLNFYNASNNARGQIYSNGQSGKQELDLYAPDGVGVNTVSMNSFVGLLDLGVAGGTFANNGYGRFAVIGSSQDGSAAYSGFQATGPISQSTLWTLPTADGSNGQAMLTDGSTHLSFASVAQTASALSSGQCVQADANGKLTSSGAPCGSGGGGGGSSILQITKSGVQITSPTASMNFYSGDFGLSAIGTTSQIILNPATTDFIHNQQTQQSASMNISSASIIQTASTGDAMVIVATGTGKALYIRPQGNNGNAYQDKVGAVTIEKIDNAVPTEFLVIHDSTTDNQIGMGLFEIWEDESGSGHNDPLMWIHNNGNASNPFMRVDDNAPDMELVNTSTDNTHGLGKWEPMAMANTGVDLQVNNRAYDNSTFENLAYWHPLHLAAPNDSSMPGLYLRAQNVAEDGGVISSSGTSGIAFYTQNSRTRGLTGPLNATASWWDALPATTGSAGNMMYHGGTAANGALTIRQWAWSGSDYTYAPVSGVTISTLTVTSSATVNSASGLFNLYGITTGSMTVNGSGAGEIDLTEGTAPSGVASTDVLYGDSTAHWLKMNNNNGTAEAIPGVSGSPTTGNCTKWISGTEIGDAGAACGTGSNIVKIGSGTVGPFDVSTTSATFNGPVDFHKGQYFSNVNLITSNYTAVSTDTVVLASAPATGLTITLPSVVSSTGQVITITKVNLSSYPVTINAAAGDLINGTGTLTLNGYSQTDTMMAVGNGLWAPYGQGLQLTPDFIGPGQQGTSANTINVASGVICGSFYNTVPVQVDSMTVHIAAVSSQIDVGIYDNSGNRLGSSGFVLANAAGRRNVPLTNLLNLPPGYYWACLATNSLTGTFLSNSPTTHQFAGYQSCVSSAGGLTATLPFPCGNTTRLIDVNIWGHVIGGAL